MSLDEFILLEYGSPMGGFVQMRGTWEPSASEDVMAFERFIGWLSDVQRPLAGAALILENSIRGRFDTETDPDGTPWVDLNEQWAERKKDLERFSPIGESPSGDYILRLTGELYEAATDPGAFVIRGDTLVYNPTSLPEYGEYHQTGTSKMPARPWMGIDTETADAIFLEFERWIDYGIEEVWEEPPSTPPPYTPSARVSHVSTFTHLTGPHAGRTQFRIGGRFARFLD